MRSDREIALPELLTGVPLTLLIGVAIGGLGTLKHRVGATWTTPLPVGLVASLLLVAAFVVAARVLLATRLFAAAGSVGVVGAVALYTLEGPGGSVVVVGDATGTVWVVGAIALALLLAVVPFPLRRRAAEEPSGILETGRQQGSKQ